MPRADLEETDGPDLLLLYLAGEAPLETPAKQNRNDR